MRTALIVALALAASPLAAAEIGSWDEFMKLHRYKCPGAFDTLKAPRPLTLGGKSYTHNGYKLEVQNPDADSAIKLGVLSAIKDTSAGTKQNLDDAFKWFKAEGVEWVVVNGDIALEEFDLEEVMGWLAAEGLPVVVTLGNSESKSSFARVYKGLEGKHPNLINGVWVRQLILDDVELWTVSGYFDKRFVHQGAGCAYGKEDLEATHKTLKPAGKGPVVLVSHGPPLGSGKAALDWIGDKKNVGDPELNKLMKNANISFGLFGHILEAGGVVVGKDLGTRVAENKAVSALHLNAGSVSADPWGLNDGSTSYGMAFIVSIDGQTAKYAQKKFAQRVAAE